MSNTRPNKLEIWWLYTIMRWISYCKKWIPIMMKLRNAVVRCHQIQGDVGNRSVFEFLASQVCRQVLSKEPLRCWGRFVLLLERRKLEKGWWWEDWILRIQPWLLLLQFLGKWATKIPIKREMRNINCCVNTAVS